MRILIAAMTLAAVGAAAAQTPAPACQVKVDSLTARRAALTQDLAALTADSLPARLQQAASNDDIKVLVGDFYFLQHRAADAAQWWTTASQDGDALGAMALGEHATDMTERRRAYAQAAQLGDPEGERAYGEMLVQGAGGPRLPVLGREYLIKAADDGSLAAQVLVGAALLNLPGATDAEAFSSMQSVTAGNCYLQAAAAADSAAARHALRLAYDAGVLHDPLPTPRLSDTVAFVNYLESYAAARQPAVIEQALAKDPGSPNALRALEERLWLQPPAGPEDPALLMLLARSPHDATALYFSLLGDLPRIPRDATRGNAAALHDDTSLTLGAKLASEGASGQTALDDPGLTLGLDMNQFQRRLVALKAAFSQAAALKPAVTAGQLWVHPQSADDVVSDYIAVRGGLDALDAVAAAHLTLQVVFTQHGHSDSKSWQREQFVARAERYPYHTASGSSDSDSFTLPSLDANTTETIFTNGHGWAMKSDYGPQQWGPDQSAEKRDKKIPPDFGQLHAPLAGALDGPLVEYARLHHLQAATPTLTLMGREQFAGRTVYHLHLDANPGSGGNNSDATPAYDAWVDTSNYQLVHLAWTWPDKKDTTASVDYSDYKFDGTLLVPGRAVYTLPNGSDPTNADTEQDTIVQLQLNPALDPTLFSLTHDQADKIRKALQQHDNSN